MVSAQALGRANPRAWKGDSPPSSDPPTLNWPALPPTTVYPLPSSDSRTSSHRFPAPTRTVPVASSNCTWFRSFVTSRGPPCTLAKWGFAFQPPDLTANVSFWVLRMRTTSATSGVFLGTSMHDGFRSPQALDQYPASCVLNSTDTGGSICTGLAISTRLHVLAAPASAGLHSRATAAAAAASPRCGERADMVG